METLRCRDRDCSVHETDVNVVRQDSEAIGPDDFDKTRSQGPHRKVRSV